MRPAANPILPGRLQSLISPFDPKHADFQGLGRVTVVAMVLTPWGFPCVLSRKANTKQEYIFPQGGILAGETVVQAVMRELRKELGISANQLNGSGLRVLGSHFSMTRNGQPKLLVGVLISLAAGTGSVRIRLSGENQAWQFVRAQERLRHISIHAGPSKRAAMMDFLAISGLKGPWGEPPRPNFRPV